MSLLRSPWTTLVELPVAVNSQMWVNFPDQPDLTTLIDQQIDILGIELIINSVLSNGPSGNINAILTEMQKATLVLVNDDKKRVYEFPVLTFNRMRNLTGGVEQPNQQDLQLFSDLSKIAWTKSGIQFLVPPAFAGSVPYSFLFQIHYSKTESGKVSNY